MFQFPWNRRKAVSEDFLPDTVIGKNTVLSTTNLSGNISIRIDGSFMGELNLGSGMLVVGNTGSIIGDIVAQQVIIGGRIEGNIICSGTIELTSTASILGNLKAKSLIVDEGASLKGTYEIGEEKIGSIIQNLTKPDDEKPSSC